MLLVAGWWMCWGERCDSKQQTIAYSKSIEQRWVKLVVPFSVRPVILERSPTWLAAFPNVGFFPWRFEITRSDQTHQTITLAHVKRSEISFIHYEPHTWLQTEKRSLGRCQRQVFKIVVLARISPENLSNVGEEHEYQTPFYRNDRCQRWKQKCVRWGRSWSLNFKPLTCFQNAGAHLSTRIYENRVDSTQNQ